MSAVETQTVDRNSAALDATSEPRVLLHSCIDALSSHIAVLDEDGFWNEMLAFLDTAVRSGFVSPARRSQLLVAHSPDEAIDILAGACGRSEARMTW